MLVDNKKEEKKMGRDGKVNITRPMSDRSVVAMNGFMTLT